MVIADDERRYVAANAAACLLLRLPEEDVPRLRVDDLTPPEHRSQVGPLWDAFIGKGHRRARTSCSCPTAHGSRSTTAPPRTLSLDSIFRS